MPVGMIILFSCMAASVLLLTAVGFLRPPKLLASRFINRTDRQKLRLAADSLDCLYHKMPYLLSGHVSGRVNGLDINLKLLSGIRLKRLRINVKYYTSANGAFSITKETKLTEFTSQIGIKDIQTHDSYFDSRFFLDAENPDSLISLLGSDTRNKLQNLFEKTEALLIDQSRIIAEFTWDSYFDHQTILTNVRDIIALCTALSGPVETKYRLISIARQDPVYAVRLNALKVLVNSFPMDDSIKNILKDKLSSDDNEERIFSAGLSGSEGMENLHQFILNKNIPDKQVLLIIKSFRDHVFTKSEQALRVLFKSTANREIRQAILSAFSAFGKVKNLDIDDFLINHMADENNEPIKTEIIKCLGACGTIKAAETLHKMQKDTINPIISKALSDAITLIQFRYGRDKTGLLSLSEKKEEEGGLSIFDTKNGDGGQN
ncbi:MAG: hypothetical protein JW969_15540 [Spirochaetales bacterium]|nr:hypothetical protein [Spirochaetales bacterium]